MSRSCCWIAGLLIALATAGCSKQFMCNMNGTQCAKGQQQTSEAKLANIGDSCDGATCEAGAYCAQASQVCTALKPKGSRCEGSIECDGKCAQTPDDAFPVCQ